MVADWIMQGRPSPVHVIELGPGNGTMMNDMIRVRGKEKRKRERESNTCTFPLGVHTVE